MGTHPLRFLLLLSLSAAVGCAGGEEPPIERDLADIRTRDTLEVLITYNSTSYFLYRGEPMGFEYELLKAFAEEHDLTLETRVVRDADSLFVLLNRGAGDIAAARIVPREEDSLRVAFTETFYETEPAVVQQQAPLAEAELPEPVDTLIEAEEEETGGVDRKREERPDSVEIQARLVQRPSQLAGETVHLPGQRSAFYDRLVELSDTLMGDIEIVEVGGEVSAESLIRGVATGDIELTVSQHNVAQLTESYFSNLLVKPTVGQPYGVSWAVRKNAPELRAALDAWIAEQKEGGRIEELYQKYFIDRRGYRERVASEYLTSETGRLSDYDELFRRAARKIEWDWRLLASQAFQESRFNPTARSWAGATGLLQLMPPTAREFGVRNMLDPEENVEGAVRFLTWLTEYWDNEVPDEAERLKFILASYNTGHGHVEDARRLTRKHGDNPNRWEDVSYWLLQKSKRQYYTDPVVQYGFARGLEPVTYVALILDRYDHYREFVEA